MLYLAFLSKFSRTQNKNFRLSNVGCKNILLELGYAKKINSNYLGLSAIRIERIMHSRQQQQKLGLIKISDHIESQNLKNDQIALFVLITMILCFINLELFFYSYRAKCVLIPSAYSSQVGPTQFPPAKLSS
jgi:hypothetical protein